MTTKTVTLGKTDRKLLAKLAAGETVTEYYEYDTRWSIGYRGWNSAGKLARAGLAELVYETKKHSSDSNGRYRTVCAIQIKAKAT